MLFQYLILTIYTFSSPLRATLCCYTIMKYTSSCCCNMIKYEKKFKCITRQWNCDIRSEMSCLSVNNVRKILVLPCKFTNICQKKIVDKWYPLKCISPPATMTKLSLKVVEGHTKMIVLLILYRNKRRQRHRGYTVNCYTILHSRENCILSLIFSSPYPTKSVANLWREDGWLLLLH